MLEFPPWVFFPFSTVELLSDALAHSGLVGRSVQGRAGGGGSTWKGKGKAVDGGRGGGRGGRGGWGREGRGGGRGWRGEGGGRRGRKRMGKGGKQRKEGSRKLGGSFCRKVGDFFFFEE